MAPIGSLYGVTRQRQTKVILAAAAVAGVEVELLPFEFGTTNKSPEFLAVVPYGKIPAFKGNDGVTFIEGAPIARHVASFAPESGLLGKNTTEAALIDQWIHFAEHEVNSFSDLTFQLTQGMFGEYSESIHKSFVERQARSLKYLNEHLSTRTYLVSDTITLADIVLAGVTWRAGRISVGAVARQQYPRVFEHFHTVVSDPRIKDIFGEPGFTEEPIAFKPKDPSV